jgi:hypothetical protein
MPMHELFDVLDTIDRDATPPDSTHAELVADVEALYTRGAVTSPDILAAYEGGL